MASLRVIRKLHGKSLRQLSLESGIALATLQRIERADFDPRLSTLRAVAKALEVPISQLLGEEPEDSTAKSFDERSKAMVKKDDVQARNAAVDRAVKALEQWRREYFAKGLWENHIWPYEYDQVRDTTKLVVNLLTNLKGPDSRNHE